MSDAKWKVTGLGGVFVKVDDTKGVASWFSDKLGLPTESWGRMFPWREVDSDEEGYTVLGLHSRGSDSFEGTTRDVMLNLRVDDLEAALVDLEARGVKVIKRIPDETYGKFAHVMGPDGIKLELFQPAKDDAPDITDG